MKHSTPAPTPIDRKTAAYNDRLFKRVREIIAEQLGIAEAEIKPDSDFVNDLNADSLDTVELVMAFEEAFDIAIADDDAEKIRTVQDALTYLRDVAKVGI